MGRQQLTHCGTVEVNAAGARATFPTSTLLLEEDSDVINEGGEGVMSVGKFYVFQGLVFDENLVLGRIGLSRFFKGNSDREIWARH